MSASGIPGAPACTSDVPVACRPREGRSRRSGMIRPGLGPGALLRRQMLRRCAAAPRRMGFVGPARPGLAVWAAHASAQFPGREPQGETVRGGGLPGVVDQEQEEDFREYLLSYVREVEPRAVEEIVQDAPTQVIEAMQHTLKNVLGTLPPKFFDVRVSTVAENLSQLMFTFIMTGYMFRNAEIRLGLHRSLGLLPPGGGDKEIEEHSVFTAQKTKVQGDVVRWNDETGAESMPAVEYMVQLEEEVKMLRCQVGEQHADIGRNDLLAYIKSLDTPALEALTEGAGEDVKLAMHVFIKRLMEDSEHTELSKDSCDTTAFDLAKLLYWLMLMGYELRTREVRHEMDLTYSSSTSGLPKDM
eukprot:evm.model.scf_161.11 EVM.evm.TU.scf_161.11   scf_161:104525-107709(-)